MPKIIVTSRYLKNESAAKVKNLVKYMATREGVKKLVSYIAERPGVKKISEHGLFSETNQPIDLAAAMKEAAEHSGNVWSHVVSLKREDAERLGFITPEVWRKLLLRNLDTIAGATNIPLEDVSWYAAFHDKAHHPHIHLLVFSKNPDKKGYLTKKGIEQIKSKLVNDIFHDELIHLYQKQTDIRDRLCREAEIMMERYVCGLNKSESFEINTALENLMTKLHSQLKTVKGKKTYGYLPKEIKSTVDEILDELSKHTVVSKMYEAWCELEREKFRTYSDKEPEIVPLSKQDAFKPMKNAIIKAVAELNFSDMQKTYSTESKVRTSRLKSPANAAFSLLKALGKLIANDYEAKLKSDLDFSVDRKQWREITEQKNAMGIKEDSSIHRHYI